MEKGEEGSVFGQEKFILKPASLVDCCVFIQDAYNQN
jgi:hypothetical protein